MISWKVWLLGRKHKYHDHGIICYGRIDFCSEKNHFHAFADVKNKIAFSPCVRNLCTQAVNLSSIERSSVGWAVLEISRGMAMKFAPDLGIHKEAQNQKKIKVPCLVSKLYEPKYPKFRF